MNPKDKPWSQLLNYINYLNKQILCGEKHWMETDKTMLVFIYIFYIQNDFWHSRLEVKYATLHNGTMVTEQDCVF